MNSPCPNPLPVPFFIADTPQVPRQAVEKRAYELWVQRGCPEGTQLQDWVAAEDELRQALLALAQSRERFRLLLQTAGSVVVWLAPDFRIWEWNQAAERIYGWTKREVLGKDFFQLCLPGTERSAAIAHLQKILVGEPTPAFETPNRTSEGEQRLLGWSAFPLFEESGRLRELLLIGQDVTQRKQDEERYRNLFENAVEGLCQTTPDGRFLSVNRALARMYGYASPEEMVAGIHNIGQTVYVDAGRRTELRRLLEEQGVVRGFECQVYRKDRSVMWISQHSRVVRDADGKLLYYEGIIQDITARKQAEEDLRQVRAELETHMRERTAELAHTNEVLREQMYERVRAEEANKNSETLYQSLVEHLPRCIFRKDSEGRFTFANDRFCVTVGKPLADVLGKTDFDFYPPELAEKYRADDQQVMASGETLEAVEEHVRPDGERLYVQFVKIPLRDFRGAVGGVQCIFWDVTARRRDEETLRDREQRLQLALEAGQLGTWDWDVLSGKLQWSRSLEAIHGMAPGTFGGTFAEFLKDVHPDDREAVKQAITRALEQGEGHHVEYRVPCPDGTTHWVEGRGRVLRDQAGRPVRLLGVCQDVSARRRAEQRVATEHAVTLALSESDTLAGTARRILQAVCENLGAQVGTFWRVDPAANLLRCVEVWHAPAVQVPDFERATRAAVFAAGVGLPGRVWSSGKATRVADVVADANFPRADIAAREGLHGAFCFPILLGAQVLGILEFFSRQILQPQDDLLAMLASIGSQIGQFLERRDVEQTLRVRAAQFQVARRIQQGMLPRAAPAVPGLDIAGASWPAEETGGDCYDFFPLPDFALPDSKLAVLIGDASGHGIGPALFMAETRAYLRGLACNTTDISRILRLTNRHLAAGGTDLFVTLFLAQIDLATRTLVYASAGHSPGFVLDRHGAVKATLNSTDLPLGVKPSVDFPVGTSVALAPGDLVLLLTDGVLDTHSPEGVWFRATGALEVVRAHRTESARAITEALYDAVLDFARGTALADDVTVVVIKILDA